MPAISALTDPSIRTYVNLEKLTHTKLNADLVALKAGVDNLNDVVADLQKNFAGGSPPTDNTVRGGLYADTTTSNQVDLKCDPDGNGADIIIASLGVSGLLENSANWPAFSVHRNAVDQTSVGTTLEIIKWTVELFDTNSDFAIDADDSGGAGESRFTPTIAGKYLITCTLTFSIIGDGDTIQVSIFKDGSELHSNLSQAGSTGNTAVNISAIVDMNGSTSYIEIFGANLTSTDTVIGIVNDTWFTGCRIA